MKSLRARRAALALSVLALAIIFAVALLGLANAPAAVDAAPVEPQPAPGVTWTAPATDTTPPSASGDATAVANLIPGGSFEEPGVWNEEINSTNCDVPSKIGDWRSIFTDTVAYDGTQTLWVGGVCLSDPPVPLVNSAAQIITVPATRPILSLWYYAERWDPDSVEPDDYAYVEVNQERLWELPLIQAFNTGGWVNLRLDLGAYAGQEVELKLGNETFNLDTYVGNVLFDQIAFQEPPPTLAEIDPEIGGKLTYVDALGFSAVVEVPPNAVSQTTRLSYAPRSEPGFPLPAELIFANRAFDLDASENLLFLPAVQGGSVTTAGAPAVPVAAEPQPTVPSSQSFTFLRPITITVEYSDEDIGGIAEDTLRLYYYDEAAEMWKDVLTTCPDPGRYTSNPDENFIQVQACHLSEMGMIGK